MKLSKGSHRIIDECWIGVKNGNLSLLSPFQKIIREKKSTSSFYYGVLYKYKDIFMYLKQQNQFFFSKRNNGYQLPKKQRNNEYHRTFFQIQR